MTIQLWSRQEKVSGNAGYDKIKRGHIKNAFALAVTTAQLATLVALQHLTP